MTKQESIRIEKVYITHVRTDAIVNAANEGLLAGGGVCGAIFEAAGYEELQKACNKIGHCDTGSAVITPGFNLAPYIIHAVGPVWKGGNNNERVLLYKAYKKALKLAKENNCESIAFPLISVGIFGYPVNRAWDVAIEACKDYGEDLEIIFAVLSDDILKLGQKILNGNYEIVAD